MHLYEIANEIRSILDLVDESGEIDPEAESNLAELEMALPVKLDGCCRAAREYEAEAAAFEAEEKRLAHKKQTARNNAARIRDYVERTLKEMNIDRIQTELFTLKFQNNPPSVLVLIPVDQLPPEFQRVTTTVEPDKKAILLKSKNNEPLPPGIEVRQTRSLRVT